MMRRWVLAGGILAILMPGAVQAELTCPSPMHTARPATSGTVLKHTFALVNRTGEAIDIVEVKPGCGCVVPALDRVRLAAGEQAALRVEVNTVTQAPGSNSWKTTVRYRQGSRESELSLLVSALLIPEIHIQPAALVLQTSTAMGHPFTLSERRTRPLELRGVACRSPHFRFTVSSPVQQNGVWVRTVRLDVLPSCPEGRHEDVMHVHTADAAYPELKVPFTVIKQTPGLVRASPSSLHLTDLPGQPLPARILLLETPDDQPIAILRIEPSHPGIRCTWASGPGPRATLRVQVDPGSDARPFEGTVRIHVSKPSAQVVTIPVRVAR